MPMRSETDWAIEMTPDLNYVQLLPLIIAIQRDALEAAAKMCEKRAEKYLNTHDDCTNAEDRDSLRWRSAAAIRCANDLRSLIPTDGSAKATS